MPPTVEILKTDEIAEQYKVSRYFIHIHAIKMGGRGKPARFERTLVDAFFHRYFREEIERHQMVEADARARTDEIDREVSRFAMSIKEAKVGQIQGKFQKK